MNLRARSGGGGEVEVIHLGGNYNRQELQLESEHVYRVSSAALLLLLLPPPPPLPLLLLLLLLPLPLLLLLEGCPGAIGSLLINWRARTRAQMFWRVRRAAGSDVNWVPRFFSDFFSRNSTAMLPRRVTSASVRSQRLNSGLAAVY